MENTLLYVHLARLGSSSTACLHQYWLGMCRTGGTGLRSLLAETWNKPAARAKTTTPATPVFLFQLAGLFHHPPAGDHTCV